MYKKLVNPTEEEVNEVLMKENYSLHSVTPVRRDYTQTRTDLIYHFIKEVAFPEWKIGVDLAQDCIVEDIDKSPHNLS